MDEVAARRGRGRSSEVIGRRCDSEVAEVGVEVEHDDGVEAVEIVEVVSAEWGF